MFLLWLRVAVLFYGLAAITVIPGVLGSRPLWRRLAMPLALGGWLFHFVSSVEMLIAAHRWMPVGPREIAATLALLIVTVFLFIAWRYRTISFGLFALPLAFLLTIVPAIGPGRYTFSSPLVRNGWIIFHVTALLAAYAALLFSMLSSILYLAQERRLKNRQSPGFVSWLPPLNTMEEISQTTLVIGFVCMTAGLFAGSLIAQEQVGAAYFADPKVLLSFVMWALYVALLFIRRSTGLRGRRAAWLSSVVFVAIICVWAANLLSSVHRFSLP
ncbi:cytochrome C assembly family protein [Paracidobacterium acidisoli]|uniref:Cytochrome C biogenesis protein n=1 Tax=Paracidobacterium acidisoli TaxID=2303751 RepID=A0A372IRA5_9BACT|nr:cytochrome c biogenesis protein CcsA [Paracidobacterium acidisoli]MBT9330155.1 cytochrome c biogenesis protein CcsA [Paracidobacterium acidisoli]